MGWITGDLAKILGPMPGIFVVFHGGAIRLWGFFLRSLPPLTQ